MRRLILPLVSSALLSGCALSPGLHLNTSRVTQIAPRAVAASVSEVPITQQVIAHLMRPKNYYEYLVGPDDILSITVWDHPELTNPQGQFRSAADTGILVNADGKIFYPFAGEVKVSGLSVEQIRKLLARKLAYYIRKPQVSVRVATFASRKIQVLGAVNGPKTEPITNVPLSLMDAINAAGGFDSNMANARRVFVIRGPISHPTMFWLDAGTPDSLLLAGDFYLRDRDVVYVSTAGIADWNKFMTNLMPTIQNWWTVHTVTK